MGTRIICEMQEGRDVRPPGSMLHDTMGKDWPYRSLLIGSFRAGPAVESSEVPHEDRKYLGRTHRTHRGTVELPPRKLSDGWEKIGVVEVLFYWRGGTRAPGGMRHEFNKTGLRKILLGSGTAVLYQRGRWYRIELPRKAIVDDRGIVYP